MKKIVLLFTIVISTAIFYFTPVQAEVVRSFNADIVVEKNGTTAITETIVYDSEGIERRGIFRTIRLRSSDGEKVSLNNLSVVDLSGVRYDYTVQRSNDGITIKIGNEAFPFVGEKTYVIEYEIDGAVTHLTETLDEFYWNITGDTWPFRIETVQARITLPEGVVHTASACYQGIRGSQESCRIENEGSIFSSTRILTPGEGFTVALGFPAGAVIKTPPTVIDRILDVLFMWWPTLLIFIIGIPMGVRWYRKGRDAKGRGVIVTQYFPPEGVPLLDAAVILDQKISIKSIIAGILDLAIRKYLVIKKISKEERIYQITLKKIPDQDCTTAETLLLQELFYKGDTTSVIPEHIQTTNLKRFDKKFIDTLRLLPKKAYKPLVVGDIATLSHTINSQELTDTLFKEERIRVVTHGYYTTDFLPKTITLTFKKFKTIAFLFIVLFLTAKLFSFNGQAIGDLLFQNDSTIIIFIVSMVMTVSIAAFFHTFMPAKTEKGMLTKEHLLGLREYIRIAEKDRIAFHNNPEVQTTLFEKLLPYAVLFGLETKWAKAFEGLTIPTPNWYESNTGPLTPALFVSELSDGFRGSIFSTPSQSGGGSGGGGFSGGGGGGGGGGSW